MLRPRAAAPQRLPQIRKPGMVGSGRGGANMIVTFVGYAAAFCTTISFLPQAIKIWRTRSTKDISRDMFAIFTVGVALWLAYGLALHDIPMIAANGVTFVLAALILGFKLRYG
jgi:MtN3 and saliva related transmembrane protein